MQILYAPKLWVLALLAAISLPVSAQSLIIRRTTQTEIPTQVDGNSPSFWRDGQFRYLTSTGRPVILEGAGPLSLGGALPIALDRMEHMPMWIESVWQDEDGTLYGWYHHEPGGLCVGNTLTAPEIGAAISRDGGSSFEDLGIVLKSGDPLDCNAKNGFFAGGHGDFSVILDRDRTYFYFLFTNYGGGVESQGIAVARLAFEDRGNPTGAVRKYYDGDWTEPGVGGRVTPAFPAAVSWQSEKTDSLWGPAISWNTYLEQYVILLNHACCATNWPQEGIFATFVSDLSNPSTWAAPYRILNNIGFGPGYYPQVVGLNDGETDSISGQAARLYIQGRSYWEIEFSTEPPDTSLDPVDPNPPERTQLARRRRT